MSQATVQVQRRLLVPVSELVELVRKHYGVRLPDDCAVCVGDSTLPMGTTAVFGWTTQEPVAPKVV